MKHRPNRIQLVLSALVVLLIMLLPISLVSLDDDFYRRQLMATIAAQTDYQLQIDGTFQVHFSITPGFMATGISISSQDHPTVYSADRLGLNVSLFSLLFGDPVIAHLAIEGMVLDLAVFDDKDSNEEDRQKTAAWTLPRVSRVDLRDVVISHDDLVIAELANWRIEENIDADSMELRGEGDLLGQQYQIQGELGCSADRLSTLAVCPVRVELRSAGDEITVAGSVREPLLSGHLQLNVAAQAPVLSETLSRFGYEMPDIGRFHFSGVLRGPIADPILINATALVAKDNALEVKLTGELNTLLTPVNDYLSIAGVVEDPELLAWLLPVDPLSLKETRFDGTLVSREQGVRFDELEIVVGGKNGSMLALEVNGELQHSAENPLGALLDVTVDARLSDVTIAIPQLQDRLPEIGPVQGQFRVINGPEATISVSDIRFSGGEKNDVSFLVHGDIGQFPVDPLSSLSGMNLQLELLVSNGDVLGDLIEAEIPDLTPLRMTGHYQGSILASSLHSLVLQAGKAGQQELYATGSIQLDDLRDGGFLKGVDLNLDFTSGTTQQAAEWLNQELPELGPVEASIQLKGEAGAYKASSVDLQIGAAEGLQVKVGGDIGRVQIQPEVKVSGINLQLDVRAPGLDDLSPLLGLDLPNLGGLVANATLTEQDERFGLGQASVSIGPEIRPVVTAAGSIDDLLEFKQVSWQIKMDMGAEELLGPLLGRPLPELGKLIGEVVLMDSDGSLGIEKITLASKGQGLLALRLDGIIDDLANLDELEVNAEMSTQDLKTIGMLLGLDWPSSQPARMTGRMAAKGQQGLFDSTLTVGETKVLANIAASLDGARPDFKGEITTEVLRLADFGFPRSFVDKAESPSDVRVAGSTDSDTTEARVFSEQPFTVDWMQAFDLELELSADEVIGTNARLDSFSIPVSVKQGQRVAVESANFVYEEGAFIFDFLMETADKPQVNLRMTADDVEIGLALANVGWEVPVDGSLNLNVDLFGRGQSPAELAADLNGLIEVGMEHMMVPRRSIDLLAVDLLGWTLNSAFARGQQTRLDCGIVRLDLVAGQLSSDVFFFDGPELTLTGEGSVQLREETLDLSLYPRRKGRLLSNVTPVNISGRLSQPSIRIIPARATATGLAGLAAAPQIFIPMSAMGFLGDLFARDRGKGDNSACLAYTNAAEQ